MKVAIVHNSEEKSKQVTKQLDNTIRAKPNSNRQSST